MSEVIGMFKEFQALGLDGTTTATLVLADQLNLLVTLLYDKLNTDCEPVPVQAPEPDTSTISDEAIAELKARYVER